MLPRGTILLAAAIASTAVGRVGADGFGCEHRPAPAPVPLTVEAESPEQARELLLARLNAELAAAAEAKDLPKAERALVSLAKLQPAAWQPRFNLASVRARMGIAKRAEAIAAMHEALALGFDDAQRLTDEPAFAELRSDEQITAFLAEPEALLVAQRDARVKRAQARFGGKLSVQTNDALRVVVLYAPSIPQPVRDDASEQLRLTALFWASTLRTGREAGKFAPPWVLVVVPPREKFDRWAAEVTGARAGSLAGLYDHDSRELVTRDVGSTLRHEFAHVLHHREMMAWRQQHPIWIQEGLCALLEDISVVRKEGEPEKVVPLPSWRTNTVQRMATIGNLPPLAELLAMQHGKFVSERTLANYGTARGVFLFLYQRGWLGEWYAAYTDGLSDAAGLGDATGRAALERVSGKPLAELEREFRKWARELPRVAEAGSAARSLGVDLEQAPDGLVVSGLDVTEVRAGGFLPFDVVQQIGAVKVRDGNELAAALEGKPIGEVVAVLVKRQRQSVTLKITLQ